MKNSILFLLMFLALIPNLLSQVRTVKGTVYESNTKMPLQGIKVSIKDTTISVITDENGNFKIKLPKAMSTVSFSEFQGMTVNEIKMVNDNTYNIFLSNIVDIFDLSFEELLTLEVTSVSKKTEKLQNVATSVYIITQEDIQRSGYTRLIEVINLACGFFFQDITYLHSSYALHTELSPFSKLIVFMVDGVNIASFQTSGLISYNFDLPLEQIDRIEIIKGPGGVIYGANANCGVINVFTKDADKSEGLKTSVSIGNMGYNNIFLRYSHKISEKNHISAYFNYKRHDGYPKNPHFEDSTIVAPRIDKADTIVKNKFIADDVYGVNAIMCGINMKNQLSTNLTNTMNTHYFYKTSDFFTATHKILAPFIIENKTQRLQITDKLDYNFSNSHNLFLALKFATTDIDAGTDILYNIELQDNITFKNHNISIGANLSVYDFNFITDRNQDINYIEPYNTEFLYSIFVQDKVTFNKLDIIGGIKSEVWTLISRKPQYSPSLRFSFYPKNKLTLWGAYSRSYSIPAYSQTNLERVLMLYPNPTLYLPGTNELIIGMISGKEVKPTLFDTYELGIRFLPIKNFNIDLSGYYSYFKDNIFIDSDFSKYPIEYSQIFPDRSIIPVYYTNIMDGEYFGVDAVLKYMMLTNLTFEMSYSFYQRNKFAKKIPNDPQGIYYNIESYDRPLTPMHILKFRTYFDISEKNLFITLNTSWHSDFKIAYAYNYVTQAYNDNTGVILTKYSPIPRLDLQIEKRFFRRQLGISIFGNNILANKQLSYNDKYTPVPYPQVIHHLFGIKLIYNFL